jgi:hypothetical protein
MKAGATFNNSSISPDASLDIIAENQITFDGEISAEEAEELQRMMSKIKMNAMEIEEDELQMEEWDGVVTDNHS